MALALNNLKRVDMPLNKETKPSLRILRLVKDFKGIIQGVMTKEREADHIY